MYNNFIKMFKAKIEVKINQQFNFYKDLLMMIKKVIQLILIFNISFCLALSRQVKSKDFVYLNEVDPTILTCVRYCSNDNFVGKVIDGYKNPSIILTKQAAEALRKVQEEVKKDGYCLVVYDGYRPQKASNNFVKWAKDIADQNKKEHYYPRIDKKKLFELKYIGERSSHSRGSTVDLTLIKDKNSLHKIKEKKRKLLDGFTITFLDDGTIDMGSSFDLFDVASHYENNVIEDKFKKIRNYLKNIMEKNGFKSYTQEWWHFTLNNEPYPASVESNYFNFEVK